MSNIHAKPPHRIPMRRINPYFLKVPRKWRKKGGKDKLSQDIRGWKRLLNAETSLQHATF
jgi:hypothetical protein